VSKYKLTDSYILIYIEIVLDYGYIYLSSIYLSFNKYFCRVSMRMYVLVSLVTLGTMGFSNASMVYLNYPTQVRNTSFNFCVQLL